MSYSLQDFYLHGVTVGLPSPPWAVPFYIPPMNKNQHAKWWKPTPQEILSCCGFSCTGKDYKHYFPLIWAQCSKAG